MRRQIDQEKMDAAIDAVVRWNERYRVGQVVEYQSHPEAPPKIVRTRSKAFLVDHDTACLILDKIGGAVAVSVCRPVEADAASELASRTRRAASQRDGYAERIALVAALLARLAEAVDALQLAVDDPPLASELAEGSAAVAEAAAELAHRTNQLAIDVAGGVR